MLTKIKNVKYLLVIFFIAFLSWEVSAKENDFLAVHGGYTFETTEGQRGTAVYLSFFNPGKTDVNIKSFSSNIAEKVEMHDIKLIDDVMKMFPIKNLKIASKSELFLQPGGKHLMFFGLKRKLNDGEIINLKIHLDSNKVLETNIMVLNKKLRENYLN